MMSLIQSLRLATLLVLFIVLARASAFAGPVCQERADAMPDLRRLEDVMITGRFVAYDPTSLQFVNGQATHADEASMLEDLKVLRSRFDGLITYTSANGADKVADVAAKLGYRALIMGVYDIASREELDNALAAAKRHPELVVGLSIGNEVAFSKRATLDQIVSAVMAVRRRAPALALTTTEPFHIFLQPAAEPLLSQLDFMLVNVHPIYESWFRFIVDENAADFVVQAVDKLAEVYCGPILVKETGEPTAPGQAGYTPTRQALFYDALYRKFPSTRARAFAYFCAFDAPWRVNDGLVLGIHPGPEDSHWGIYDEKRRPKPVVNVIPILPKLTR
jgi:exo-beta-1,3-glucanase (GH17 family)